jgi:hypothetical protein
MAIADSCQSLLQGACKPRRGWLLDLPEVQSEQKEALGEIAVSSFSL